MSKIEARGSSNSFKRNSNWREGAPSLSKKFCYILEHEQFYDVTFRVSENGKTSEIFKAHKLVLMTASEVFERMFNGNFAESSHDSENPIEVVDIDPSSFKAMLKFIYTEEVPEPPTVTKMIRLLNAAIKYNIAELEKYIWIYLEEKLTVNDGVKILQTAQLYENKALADDAVNLLMANFEDILETEDFNNLSMDNLRMFLTVENTRVESELSIFQAIMRWSAAKCNEQNIILSPTNQRLVLGDIVNLINFSRIPAADIASAVIPSEILTDKESKLLLQHCFATENHTEQLPELPFSKICRKRKTYTVKFSGFQQQASTLEKADEFTFKVDQKIEIVGFGLLGTDDSTIPHVVSPLILTDEYNSDVLSRIENQVVFPLKGILTVELVNPVEIQPHQYYKISYFIKDLSVPWIEGDETMFTENGVNFYVQSDELLIPQILFRRIP